LNNRLNSFNPSEGTYENENKVKEIEQMISNIENQIEELDIEINDDQKLSSQRPLINKMNKVKEELEISKNKFKRKKEAFKTTQNIELLKEGKLTGADKTKAERDMIIDLNKETDLQGNIIESIGNNIKDANRNLVNINDELNNQGDQINRINDHVQSANQEVKATNKIMTNMEKRAACLKVLGIITIIIITIFNLALLIYKLINRFGKKNKPPSNPQNPKNGTNEFDIFFNNEELDYIDMEKEWKNSYGFDIFKEDKINEKEKEFNQNYYKSKVIKENIGIYWVSNANNETEAEAEANMVLDCIKDKQFKYPFYYYIDDLDKNKSEKIADKFCSVLEKNDYICRIHLKKGEDIFNRVKNKYTMWISEYCRNFTFKSHKGRKFYLWRNKNNRKIIDKDFNINTDLSFTDFQNEN
jgi:hypothetical protein